MHNMMKILGDEATTATLGVAFAVVMACFLFQSLSGKGVLGGGERAAGERHREEDERGASTSSEDEHNRRSPTQCADGQEDDVARGSAQRRPRRSVPRPVSRQEEDRE